MLSLFFGEKMKPLIIVLSVLFSTAAFSNSVEGRLAKLQKRVIELEEKLSNSKKIPKSTGLKVKNMKNEKINSRSLSSYGKESSTESLSKKQQTEIMDQINTFKKKSEENQKVLDELMKDDF
jgi:hypothetical protein